MKMRFPTRSGVVLTIAAMLAPVALAQPVLVTVVEQTTLAAHHEVQAHVTVGRHEHPPAASHVAHGEGRHLDSQRAEQPVEQHRGQWSTPRSARQAGPRPTRQADAHRSVVPVRELVEAGSLARVAGRVTYASTGQPLPFARVLLRELPLLPVEEER